MNYIVPLEICERNLLEVVGGKATGLGALLRHELPVPPGFAVSTDAYREFMAATGLGDAVQRVLEDVQSMKGELQASRRIRHLFEEFGAQDSLLEQLGVAYAQLCGQGDALPVAVRSSAVGEDASQASFAGEHETYLWIRGAADVARSVLRCWASLFTPQALAYFRRLGLHPADTAMGVVVQAMVAAEAAGVMITIDPLTGDRSQISIEASHGLGVAVVGGEVTPDRYFLDKVTLDVRSQTISPKPIAYRFDPATGEVRAFDVPPEDQGRPCLTDDEVREVAALGKRVERALGSPQDIEWAVGPGLELELGPGLGEERKVFLLQTRPETVWSSRPIVPITDPAAPVMTRLVRNMRIPMRIVDSPRGIGS